MEPESDYWLYAREAFRSASLAKDYKEKQAFIDLAKTWTEAALAERKALKLEPQVLGSRPV